jgi:energy-coupling factor transporter ATP-binding protein EcfA2
MLDLENNFLKKYISPEIIKPELKKEHELNTEDRMYLINKKLDENFLLDIYENLINDKKYISNDINNVEINDYVFNDIEFLSDHYSNDEKGIFSKLNKCKTMIGSLLLKNIFLKPTHDINLLKMRQTIFQKISTIKKDLYPLLDEIKILENDLIWFWNDSNIKHMDLMNDLIYFNYDFIPFFNVNDILNNNEKALLVTNIYKIVVAPLLTIITPLLSLLIPIVLIYYMQRKANIKIPICDIIKQYIKTLFGTDSMKLIFKNPTKALLASIVTKGIYLFMYFQNIYYSLQNASNTNKIINIIHEKLNKMASYIKTTNKIKTLCIKNGINDITPYINYNSIQNDLMIYDDYFNSSVFNSNPSLFSNKGKILQIFRKFKENKDPIVSVFHYTGIIDVICSIENILSENIIENPYCIATFLEKDVPLLSFKNIWHPFLNKETTDNNIKNSVDINNNILITGPNAAGKSTFIKSVIVNIILSQTIGICSAEKFEITPFKIIETYLHIPDSKGTSSLFEAEMFRSKDYIDKIKNLDKDKFSFIVLDEIFSSTNYVEGFSGAYSILKKISSFSNTLSITTTHYTDLEILEKDTNGKIINYKFDIEYNKNNEIIFNYILKRGVSRQYIALKLLKKNGFDNDVIETAIDICNKIKEKKLIFFKNEKIKKQKNNKKTTN